MTGLDWNQTKMAPGEPVRESKALDHQLITVDCSEYKDNVLVATALYNTLH